MKLYATTRSERAEKGQGGNQFVRTTYQVEHDDKTREEVAVTELERSGGEFILRHIPVHGDDTVTRIPIRQK